MNNTSKAAVIAAIVLGISFSAAGATIVLSGPGVTEDNTLYSSPYTGFNYGGGIDNNAGNFSSIVRRSLLRFDLSSLSGKTVTSASLQLTLRVTEGAYSNQTINLHPIFPSNAGWVEGTANFTAQPGSSDWDYAVDNTTPWRNSGGTGSFPGLGNVGDGYASTPAGSFVVNSTDPADTPITITITDLSVLQNWVDNPSQNAGLLIASPGLEGSGVGSWRWYQSEDSTAVFRPVLTVQAVPEPSTLLLCATTGLLLRRRPLHG